MWTMQRCAAALLVVGMAVSADAGWFWQEEAKVPEAEYHVLSRKFRAYHTVESNIFAHMITTPLSLFAAAAMINKVLSVAFATQFVTAVYCVSLHDKIPGHLIALTGLAAASLSIFAARGMRLSWGTLVSLFVIGYAGQEAAHFLTGEATFQSEYQEKPDFLKLLAEHTYYLLPLVFDAALPAKVGAPLLVELADKAYFLAPMVAAFVMQFICSTGALTLPFMFHHSRVVMVKLTKPQDVKDLADIRGWAMSKGPSKTTSTHWWYQAPNDTTAPAVRASAALGAIADPLVFLVAIAVAFSCLEDAPKAAFKRIATCDTIANMFRERFGATWRLDVLDGMNEVYVSSPHTVKNTSDEVFYTRHIDGPYYFVPFASCFRMIIGLDANEAITTKFPMVPTELAAQKGDVLAFDFHREVHYIEKNDGITNKDFRIVLKVHYCIYPRWAIFFGKLLGLLSTRYNMAFRSLFLYTINPSGLFNQFAAWNVVFWTKVVHQLEEKLGYANIGWFATLAVLSYNTSYLVFLLGTSFLHYVRYMTTYYVRENVAYGIFKRDVLLYKTVSLAQLVFLYASAATKGFTSLADLGIDATAAAMIAGGYALSLYTTAQLGVDGTYFGIELGFVQKQKHYVQKFPYGVIPHPMILSQCVALCGFHRHAAFATAWPYLVPVHVLLYLCHMVQEHFDIHAGKGNAQASKQGMKLKA